MKKLLLTLLLTTSFAATAQHNHHYNYNHRYYKPNNNWVAPALIGTVIGGAIVYGATRPQYYAPPPVVYAPQTPVPPYGYHYENIVDSACNCVRTILVPN
jgi:hypothetical protein